MIKSTTSSDGFKFLCSLILCLGVELLAAWATSAGAFNWYKTIKLPEFTPPNFLFSPVWFALYILMALALWTVWKVKKPPFPTRKTFVSFFVQLLLNLIWPIVFFTLHQLFWSVVVIVFLWLAIVWNLIEFVKVRKTAFFLLLPYFLWVSYAVILNISIWIIN